MPFTASFLHSNCSFKVIVVMDDGIYVNGERLDHTEAALATAILEHLGLAPEMLTEAQLKQIDGVATRARSFLQYVNRLVLLGACCYGLRFPVAGERVVCHYLCCMGTELRAATNAGLVSHRPANPKRRRVLLQISRLRLVWLCLQGPG